MIITFRTECEADGANVLDLLEHAKIKYTKCTSKLIPDALVPDYKMWMYTLEIEDNVEIEALKKRLQESIDNEPRFVDMHRCFQTLIEGTEPNERWFES